MCVIRRDNELERVVELCHGEHGLDVTARGARYDAEPRLALHGFDERARPGHQREPAFDDRAEPSIGPDGGEIDRCLVVRVAVSKKRRTNRGTNRERGAMVLVLRVADPDAVFLERVHESAAPRVARICDHPIELEEHCLNHA